MIESTQNKKVKLWKKLKTKKGRQQENLYLVEGEHLVREAVAKLPEMDIQNLILTEEHRGEIFSFSEEKIVYVSHKVAMEIAETETTQGMFAVIEKKAAVLPRAVTRPYLFLDAVQDPGNMGALIRTAAAAGFEGVVCGNGSVDPYNMKALRGSQGMHFNLAVYEGNLEDWISYFQKQGFPVFGTALDRDAQVYTSISPASHPFALMVGNEGQGINPGLLKLTDMNLYIPLADQVESLNVSIAAGILMFHLYDNR